MAKTPDHMAGLNALPKWDRANPTTYSYDWKNYDPADYAAFKAAKQSRQDRNIGRPARQQAIQKRISDALKKNYAKRQEGKPQPTREQINEAAKAGKPLRADLPSTCFASLTFKQDKDGNGTVFAEFYRGGAINYEYPMELDDFLDWAGSESLGVFFNAEVR
jgi:hypothetical protein